MFQKTTTFLVSTISTSSSHPCIWCIHHINMRPPYKCSKCLPLACQLINCPFLSMFSHKGLTAHQPLLCCIYNNYTYICTIIYSSKLIAFWKILNANFEIGYLYIKKTITLLNHIGPHNIRICHVGCSVWIWVSLRKFSSILLLYYGGPQNKSWTLSMLRHVHEFHDMFNYLL